MNLYESYGRQAEVVFQLQEYFHTTQDVLRALRDGEVLPSQLDVSDKGWEVRPTDTPRGTPTRIRPTEEGQGDAGQDT